MKLERRTPEATQEIQASDVLEMVDLPTREQQSSPSIMRVGVDIDVEPNDFTRQVFLAARRRTLTRYVVGAVSVSCAILFLSVLKHASASGASGDAPKTAAVAPRSPLSVPAVAAPAVAIPAPIAAAAPVSAAPVSTPDPASTVGTVRFTARPGWSVLDGKRLNATSAIVPCGLHQVKVGMGPRHDIVVPCGGEVSISR
jgi:hypothetical protein